MDAVEVHGGKRDMLLMLHLKIHLGFVRESGALPIARNNQVVAFAHGAILGLHHIRVQDRLSRRRKRGRTRIRVARHQAYVPVYNVRPVVRIGHDIERTSITPMHMERTFMGVMSKKGLQGNARTRTGQHAFLRIKRLHFIGDCRIHGHDAPERRPCDGHLGRRVAGGNRYFRLRNHAFGIRHCETGRVRSGLGVDMLGGRRVGVRNAVSIEIPGKMQRAPVAGCGSRPVEGHGKRRRAGQGFCGRKGSWRTFLISVIIDADQLSVAIMPPEFLSPLEHVQRLVRPQRNIDRAGIRNFRSERRDLQDVSMLVVERFLNPVARPFEKHRLAVEIFGQCAGACDFRIVTIYESGRRRHTPHAHFGKFFRRAVTIINPRRLRRRQFAQSGVVRRIVDRVFRVVPAAVFLCLEIQVAVRRIGTHKIGPAEESRRPGLSEFLHPLGNFPFYVLASRPHVAPVHPAGLRIHRDAPRIAVSHRIDFRTGKRIVVLEQIAFGNRVRAVRLRTDAKHLPAQIVCVGRSPLRVV